MTRRKNGLPKYCCYNTDRHGKRRVRFRKKGFTAYIAGIPWSEDFMRQYAAALQGVKAQMASIGVDRIVAGTVNALVKAYLDITPESSSPFKTGKPETQRTRRNILENFAAKHGGKPLYCTERTGKRTMLLDRPHLQAIVNEKSATPFAQRNFLNTLRAMFKWAYAEGRVPEDPTLGVTREKVKTTGYKTFSEDHIARFEATHPIGTKSRLAFALLLYTGLRRSDVVILGRQHIHRVTNDKRFKEMIVLDQGKTEGGEEAHLEIPVHPKLREIIDATPMVGVKTFLVTHRGEPYTAPGFGNWFREQCDAAGCPDVSAHGLRKATGRRLAEIGCTAHMIASILGHASLSEVERYTKAANRKLLAREGMAKLIEGGW
jgi:site-specific recombinase XerD